MKGYIEEQRKFIIEAKDLVYHYPDGTSALQGASLSIEKGAKVALLGSNGAGKSTLFLHFNGILKPQEGTLKFNGNKVKYDKRSLSYLRKNVGIVFQDPETQLFSASVYQEISFGPLNLGLSKEEAAERVCKAMKDTGITELQNKATHFLSYGQKKRVSIADVLAMEPQVIIADEPSVWLDPKHSRQIESLFQDLNEKGTTIIISTHDVDLAYSFADYVFVMNEGKIIGEGSPEEVFADEILLKKASLEKPWVFEVSTAMIQKGLLHPTTPLPRNRNELLKTFNGIKGQINHTKSFGGIDKKDDSSIVRNKGRDSDNIAFGRKGL